VLNDFVVIVGVVDMGGFLLLSLFAATGDLPSREMLLDILKKPFE
jgi:hypothetical protein